MTRQVATLFASLLLCTTAFAADAAKGHADYDGHCKTCHGATGTANPAIAKMMKVEMKDLGSAEVQALSDADLSKVITDGKGKMKPIHLEGASAAGDVAAYLRTLKQ